MRQIICDRCSKECHGTHGRLMLSRSEFTIKGEMVASDEFEAQDLCDICTEVARTTFSFMIAHNPYKEFEPVPELAMEAQLHRDTGHPGYPGHYTRPEDGEVPRTLAVGMVVDRAIATRWNSWRYMEDPPPLVEADRIELLGPGGAG